jgi:hypothetical protein
MAEQLHDLVASDVYWSPCLCAVLLFAFLFFFVAFLLVIVVFIFIIVVVVIVGVLEGEFNPAQVAEMFSGIYMLLDFLNSFDSQTLLQCTVETNL